MGERWQLEPAGRRAGSPERATRAPSMATAVALANQSHSTISAFSLPLPVWTPSLHSQWEFGALAHHSQWQWDDSAGLRPPLSVGVDDSGFWYVAGRPCQGQFECSEAPKSGT